MQKEKANVQVNHLIAMGKEKGFLTYEEVNDILPSDIFSPKQIDDMMVMFGEMNIEIVEATQKASIPKRKLQEVGVDANSAIEEEFNKASCDTFNDPVRIYLRQMGSISLLNREEEVEIAKRIEEGEKEIAAVVLHAPITIAEIISMGESLRLNNLSVKEVIRGLDDEETDIDEEQYKRKVLSLIERITRCERKNLELRKQLTQTSISSSPKHPSAKLEKKICRKRPIEVLKRFLIS